MRIWIPLCASTLLVIGQALAGNAQKEGVNEVFVVPDVVPTLAATPVPTVRPATPSPSPAPDAVLDGGGPGQEASVDADPEVSEPDEPSLEGLAGSTRVADNGVEADFFAGYRDGGGTSTEEHIWRVINCESLWRPWVNGVHLGLAQFSYGTWANVSGRTGLSDWASPYHQGVNVAVWAQLVDPGSRAGWPVCWYS